MAGRIAGSSIQAATKCRVRIGNLGLLLGLLLATTSLLGQISPGPLARAHQRLNGVGNCTRCHAVSTRSTTFRCVECHTEIAAEVQTHKGLHATFPQSGLPGAACVKCHTDHNGNNFELEHWDPSARGFDHSKTGFVLDGKHAETSCRSCHAAAHISAQFRSTFSNKDLNRTWLGLSTNCLSCHEDRHQGKFGTTCTQCHSTASWKSAKVDEKSFDHSKTAFKLVGAHQTVACGRCHTPGADGQPRFTGIAFDRCGSCHVDPHKGEFKQDCSACHTSLTWKKSSFVSTFDHSKTTFALLGKHAQVSCIACHRNGDFKSPIAHAACVDCHKSDPHSGQFHADPDGGRCERCHTVAGWSPTTFDVAAHARTGYPITGPHTTVACKSCHLPDTRGVRYKIRYAQCVDCHADEHGGQFAAAPWKNQCQNCHQGLTFKTTNYSLAMHQKNRFPLTGGHMAVICSDCHKPLPGARTAVFHFSSLDCTSCHQDVHRGEFAARTAAIGSDGKQLGCRACHNTTDWSDLSHFDHASTGFVLVGSHRAVRCAECHRPPNMERTMLHVHFADAPKTCAECHENPHADQFGAKERQCDSCHTTMKWKPSLFDHEKTGFSLKGGHEAVACTACHVNRRSVNGLTVLFYKPTPVTCEACHGSTLPATSQKQ